MSKYNLGKTFDHKLSAPVNNVGYQTKYIPLLTVSGRINAMKNHHGMMIKNRSDAIKIIERAPYNLLVYEALKIWSGRKTSKTMGKPFIKDTSIYDLYSLYKFDSFLKGKILEILRSFENMFLGSLSCNFEYEYKRIRHHIPKSYKPVNHNLGNESREKNHYELIPMWEEFFSDSSNVTMNDEIVIWNSLSKDKFLQYNKQKGVYNDKKNAVRFSKDEIGYIKKNFKISTIRRNVKKDMVSFSSKSNQIWTKDIGTTNINNLLEIIKFFRNKASHPGYIINARSKFDFKGTKNNKKRLNENFNGIEIHLKQFIELMPYFAPEDMLDDFYYSIKKRLLYMNEKGLPKKHLERLQNKIGIKLVEK